MKTVIRISTNYMGDLSTEERNNSIDSIVNGGIKVHCEIENNRMVNIVEDIKNYQTDKEDFKNKIVIHATGYTQSEWQRYTVYHNETEENKELDILIEELERSFTHQNEYLVQKFERETINGKIFDAEPHDITTFCIRHIEFPEEEDVLKEYLEIYGKDYDEVILEID